MAITNRELLVWLHKLQTFRRFGRKPDGEYYRAEGYFRKHPDWEPLLALENRRTVFRLVGCSCINCGDSLSPQSTGDHLISKARIKELGLALSGFDGAENYLPLCRSCNSSKGSKDLLEWWTIRLERSAAELSDDVLCGYARLFYRAYVAAGRLDESAPGVVAELVVRTLVESLPPEPARYFAGQAGYSPLLGGFLT